MFGETLGSPANRQAPAIHKKEADDDGNVLNLDELLAQSKITLRTV